MNIPVKLRHILILSALLPHIVLSQPLELRIISIDAATLPHIRMQAALMRGGVDLPQPGKATYSLTENGIDIPLDVDCPDNLVTNNVALVLDNSGSLGGTAFDSLKAGALAVIDMLSDIDATAIYHFSNGGERVLDFTTDKMVLRTAVEDMRRGGGTPLYRTIDMALRDLATRTGRKYCIVFTDGVDNQSIITWEELLPLAAAAGIRIYTIGYGNTELSEDILHSLAHETGGRYWRIFSSGQIAEVLRSIAVEITSPWCTISYDAEQCTDSLRFLQLRAELDGDMASDDTVFVSPFRPDTLHARVTAPARILPGERALVYIAMEPGLHTGLQLTFSFLLRYDADLLDIGSSIPITVGTITQNTNARLRQEAPGVLRFTAERVTPAKADGDLIGVVLRHIPAGFSRPVPITLEDFTLTAGCDNTVILHFDTLEVCQCEDVLSYTIETVAGALPGEEIDIPLRIPRPSEDLPVLLSARLTYDPLRLRLIGILDEEGEEWTIGNPDAHGEVRLWLHTTGRGADLQPRLRFVGLGDRTPKQTDVRVTGMTMYAQCCLDAAPESIPFWIDGICEFLLRPKDNVITELFPNPASQQLTIMLRLPEGGTTAGRLELYSAGGDRVYHQHIETGRSDWMTQVNVSGLPAGKYTVRYMTEEQMSVRTVTIVR